MKLTFLGTRGEIEARTSRHRMHSSLMVSYRGKKVMVDCGTDWLGQINDLGPEAIFVTHTHPDHAWGLKGGVPCPVYAPEEAWRLMEDYDIRDRRVMEHRAVIGIEGIAFEAFPVEHSIHAPTVGYRISAGRATVFYAPDVVYVHDREQALRGAKLYVGDGATVVRSMVRRRGDTLFGHAPIRTQLTWCEKEGVPRAIFTHCGTDLVAGDEPSLVARIEEMARERGVRAEVAHDGMEVVLR
jgi:ribonuclease BN (tRNA processing enzyme)